MPLLPVLGRLRQEDLRFQARLGYIETLSKKTKQTKGIYSKEIISV
jgi:hypothetical protein